MRFGVAPEHLEFYYQNHFIEFEDLLTKEEVTELKKNLDNSTITRDLFRTDPGIKRIVLRHKLAEIVSNLMKIKHFRIGYDILLKSGDNPFKEPTTLKEMSCIQGIVCGFILSLTEEPNTLIKQEASPLCPLPHKQGSGVFFSPETPISFENLFSLSNQTHLLIVYAIEKAVYQLAEADPYTHELKKIGYGFGDRLQNDTHPMVF